MLRISRDPQKSADRGDRAQEAGSGIEREQGCATG